MPPYLSFHKNACNGLEEKEKLHQIIMPKKINGRQFPSFQPQWVKDFMKKEKCLFRRLR